MPERVNEHRRRQPEILTDRSKPTGSTGARVKKGCRTSPKRTGV